MPPEIAYFNGQISGLAHPIRSLERMLIAAVKVVAIAVLIAVVSTLAGRSRSDSRRPAGRVSSARTAGAVISRPRRSLAVVIGLLVVWA